MGDMTNTIYYWEDMTEEATWLTGVRGKRMKYVRKMISLF